MKICVTKNLLAYALRTYVITWTDKKVNKSKMKYYTYISNSCLQNWQFCVVACPIWRPTRTEETREACV